MNEKEHTKNSRLNIYDPKWNWIEWNDLMGRSLLTVSGSDVKFHNRIDHMMPYSLVCRAHAPLTNTLGFLGYIIKGIPPERGGIPPPPRLTGLLSSLLLAEERTQLFRVLLLLTELEWTWIAFEQTKKETLHLLLLLLIDWKLKSQSCLVWKFWSPESCFERNS